MNNFNINPNIYNIEATATDDFGNEYKIKIPQGYMTISQEFTDYGTSSCSVDISGSTVSAERVDKENEMTSEDIHYFVAAKYPKHGTTKLEYDDSSKVYFYEITEQDYHLIRIGTIFFIAEDIPCKFIGCHPYYSVGSKKREDPHMGAQLRAEYVFSCLAKNIYNSIRQQETWYKITDISISGNTIDASVLDYNTIEYDKISGCYRIWNGERTEKIKTLNEVINKFKKPRVAKLEIDFNKVENAVISTEEAKIKTLGEIINEKNKEENNMNMKKIMGDFMFGKFDNTTVKYSFNGIAFQSADGTYNVYNEDGTLTNVSDMVIDIPVFAIPVAKADLKVGDVILHPADRTPLVVKENAQTAIIAVEPKSNEVKTFAPKKSIFGFDFYTKITTPMDMFGGANADESNPFGNMLPFLMFSDGEFDMNTMLMFTMMNGKDNKGFDTNMMLPLMLMSDKKDGNKIDPFMLMFMTGGNFGNFGKSNVTKNTNKD